MQLFPIVSINVINDTVHIVLVYIDSSSYTE